jgi:hypothetical protein
LFDGDQEHATSTPKECCEEWLGACLSWELLGGGLTMTIPFNINFLSRDFQPITTPRGQFTPLRCSWHTMGGPERANIAVDGDPRGLAGISALLGVPLEIHDPQGSPYWWGYVHGIDFQDGSMAHRLSLVDLANRVAVLHTLPDGVTPNLTAWKEDTSSQFLYGVRERILKLGSADEARALVWRNARLAACAYPRWLSSAAVGGDHLSVLDCRGWYETLGWRYYACGEGAPADTTAQMAAIVTTCGQFLAGIRVENPSGILTSPWRDGLSTALEELEGLAGLGDADSRAYRLRIDNSHILVVERVPRSGEADWTLGSDGCYRDQFGVRQPRWAVPVGRWVKPAGWAYAPAQPLYGREGEGFVEEWEYGFL